MVPADDGQTDSIEKKGIRIARDQHIEEKI